MSARFGLEETAVNRRSDWTDLGWDRMNVTAAVHEHDGVDEILYMYIVFRSDIVCVLSACWPRFTTCA